MVRMAELAPTGIFEDDIPDLRIEAEGREHHYYDFDRNYEDYA